MSPMDDDIRQMTCKCCGAPLERDFNGWYCEYCGTKYIGGDAGQHTLKIVTEPARVEHFACQMAVPKFAVANDHEGIAEYAMRHLSGEIAESLAQCMRYEVEYNPAMQDYIIRGDIGVVIPRGRCGVFDWGIMDDEERKWN